MGGWVADDGRLVIRDAHIRSRYPVALWRRGIEI